MEMEMRKLAKTVSSEFVEKEFYFFSACVLQQLSPNVIQKWQI